MTEPQTSPNAAPSSAPAARRRGLTLIAVAVAIAAAGWGGWHWFLGRHIQTTDNAYVQGNVVQITPQVSGTVTAIYADETDVVKAGQPLVRLDSVDARVAVAQAEAQLGQAVREVRVLYANDATQASQVQAREAELTRAQSELGRSREDLARRQPLLATGAISQEELAHAKAQLATAESAAAAARSAVQAAREQGAAGRAMTEGTRVEQHPNVLRAAAHLRETLLAVKRTELPAPVDGQVAKRSVQLGQRVQAGAPMMTLVALNALWVDANFKEGQLQSLRMGQPAELQADVYGQKVSYHGRVEGLGAGTGAAFSLLPAQNATGNWIKIVQRVPVRISLDAKELAEHPLRVGLSMEVSVDTAEQGGKPLADPPRSEPRASTTVFDGLERDADARVQQVIAMHLGRQPVKP